MDKIKLFFLNNRKYFVIVSIVLIVIILLVIMLFKYDINGEEVLYNDDLINDVNSDLELVNNEENSDNIENSDNKEIEIQTIEYIYVDIKGYVNNPNVYKIEKDSGYRVSDLINLAGGLKKDADTSIINLSMKLYDEMVIKIYSKTEIQNYLKTLETEKQKETICTSETIKNDACICNDNVNSDSNENTENKESSNTENKESSNTENTLININTASKDDLMSLPGIGESKALSIIEYRNKTKFNSIEDIKNVSGIADSVYEKIKDLIKV